MSKSDQLEMSVVYFPFAMRGLLGILWCLAENGLLLA